MGSIAPFLIWLTCIGIAAIMVGLFIRNSENEGFVDASSRKSQTVISITTCPPGSVSYITSTGNTNCCDGDLVNNTCNGTEICSLSPSVRGGLESCGDWITKEWFKRSNKFCPPTLPYYFGTLARTPGSEGCSASVSTSDGSAPEDAKQEQCKIYGNMTDELGKVDSCFNASARDKMQCPQPKSTKSMISYGNSTPVILLCNYIPKDGSTNGMPTSCMDAARTVQYIQSLVSLNAEQKSSIINSINSKKNERMCNYIASTGGWKISGDSVQSTVVTTIISPIPYGAYTNQTLLLAQSGDNIISVYIDNNGNVLNDRTGMSIAGKLSNFNVVTFDDYLKMMSTLNKSSREKDVNKMRATKL
jgi:hypothetical protein